VQWELALEFRLPAGSHRMEQSWPMKEIFVPAPVLALVLVLVLVLVIVIERTISITITSTIR